RAAQSARSRSATSARGRARSPASARPTSSSSLASSRRSRTESRLAASGTRSNSWSRTASRTRTAPPRWRPTSSCIRSIFPFRMRSVATSAARFKLLVKDSQSNPNRAAEVASDLILNGKSDLMLVASTPETTNPVADQCELNEMPCVSSIAPWQPWFFGRGGDPAKGFKWTYHFFWGLEDIIGVFTDLWQAVPTNKKVGALWPNDGDGRAWGDPERGFAPALKKLGFEMVDPSFFKPLLDDFSAQITAFKHAKVEIVTGVLIPPDFTTFWTQARQQGFRPKAVTVGKALLFPRSVEALGAIGEGLTTEVWWSPNHPFKSSLTGASSRDLAAAYTNA